MRHAQNLLVNSRLNSWVRELHGNWFNVLLKDTSAGQTLADSVAAAHAAGELPPCTLSAVCISFDAIQHEVDRGGGGAPD